MIEIGLLLLFVILIVIADFAQGWREANAIRRLQKRWEEYQATEDTEPKP